MEQHAVCAKRRSAGITSMAVPRRPLRFSKGIYVTPDHRRRGFARALIETMIACASVQGCVECASDALIDNAASHKSAPGPGFH